MSSIGIGPNYKRQPSEISIPETESMGSFCSLQTLDLSYLSINKRLVELEGGFSGCLKHSLTHLYLSSTELKGVIPDWIGDIKNLKLLDLSYNSLSGSVPSSLASLSFLEELLLNDNQLTGTLPKEFGNLAQLAHLDLCHNQLTGTLPKEFGDLAQLGYLDLSHNQLPWTLPKEFGNLAQLVHLDLSNNQLSGPISEEHFTQLGNLKTLDMSGNSPVFNVSATWVPPFLLNNLKISSCLVGPEFPTWLQTQHKLNSLDMSHNRISSTVPDWFWNLTTHNLVYLDLSFNQIQGMIPKSLTFTLMENLVLSSNNLSGPLPNLHMKSPTIFYIDLSNNSFSGPIPRVILNNPLSLISISMNKLNGIVPEWLCQVTDIRSIDFSKNHLSGELPDCWSNSSTLSNINLSFNNISGAIPGSICHLSELNSLLLNHNKMSGELPDSLKNCSQFVTLDLRGNNFTGSIPAWIGEHLPYLTALMLNSNAFVNHIPQELSQLHHLQILDLSSNNLSGPIPKSLSNLTTMQKLPETPRDIFFSIEDGETMPLTFRGREDEYNNHHIIYINYIDLSNNELSGNIPEELASLYGLQSLNLSGNTLEGEIPDELGRMKQLQSLDLSRNKLSGSIPATLSDLTFLEHFNVSYNNLSGRIPSGNQFNTFNDSSIYIGNHLCGYPLSDNCTKDGGIINEELSDGKDEDDEMLWVYIGSLSGFAVGFWTIWGVLIFKKKWRHAYFHCIDNTYNKIYVYVAVSFARMRIKMMTEKKETSTTYCRSGMENFPFPCYTHEIPATVKGKQLMEFSSCFGGEISGLQFGAASCAHMEKVVVEPCSHAGAPTTEVATRMFLVELGSQEGAPAMVERCSLAGESVSSCLPVSLMLPSATVEARPVSVAPGAMLIPPMETRVEHSSPVITPVLKTSGDGDTTSVVERSSHGSGKVAGRRQSAATGNSPGFMLARTSRHALWADNAGPRVARRAAVVKTTSRAAGVSPVRGCYVSRVARLPFEAVSSVCSRDDNDVTCVASSVVVSNSNLEQSWGISNPMTLPARSNFEQSYGAASPLVGHMETVRRSLDYLSSGTGSAEERPQEEVGPEQTME